MSVAGTNPSGEKRKKAAIAIACLAAMLVAGLLLSFETGLWSRNAGGTAARGGPGGAGYPGGAGGPGRQRPPGTGGQITAVSGNAITIQTRGGEAKTFTLTAATQITVDQKPVAATDLKMGQRVRVVSVDNKSASEVHVRTRPFGGRGGRGGYPGGSGRGGYPGGGPATAVGIS